jgi:hypothetical protein
MLDGAARPRHITHLTLLGKDHGEPTPPGPELIGQVADRPAPTGGEYLEAAQVEGHVPPGTPDVPSRSEARSPSRRVPLTTSHWAGSRGSAEPSGSTAAMAHRDPAGTPATKWGKPPAVPAPPTI